MHQIRHRAVRTVSLFLLFAIVLIGLALTPVNTHASEDVDLELLAKWSINHGSYLLDVGKYLEAIEAFDSAMEASKRPATQSTALLYRAMTLSTFLDEPDQAIEVYRDVQKGFPDHAETAAYREGLLLFDLRRYPKARAVLKHYLTVFPQGRYRYQVEALLEQIPHEPEMPSTKGVDSKQRPIPALTEPSKASVTQIQKESKEAIEDLSTKVPIPSVDDTKGKKPERVTMKDKAPTKVAIVPVPHQEPKQKAPLPLQKKPAPPLPQKAPTKPQNSSAPTSQQKPKAVQPTVRVLLFRSVAELRISGDAIRSKSRRHAGEYEGEIVVAAKNGAITIDKQSANTSSISFVADGPMRLRAGKIKKTVRGDILVSVKGKKLRVVNRIGIESYLRGVVPSESYASWPLETLRAQAVAARTYVLYQLQHRTKRPYDVVDNEGDQAYKGTEREDPRTDKAVRSTEGTILVKPDSPIPRPILAMYSANSGGHTADAKAIFRVNNDILKAQPDPWSLSGRMATWTRRFTREKVQKELARVGVKLNDLQAIEPITIGPSGRLIRVRLIHSGKPVTVRSRPVLTSALKLPEILVDIERQGSTFIFKGKGWGHGVGYSQWGGAAMGKEGKNYREILAYYYPGAHLAQLW